MPVCPKCHDAYLIQKSDKHYFECAGCHTVFRLKAWKKRGRPRGGKSSSSVRAYWRRAKKKGKK